MNTQSTTATAAACEVRLVEPRLEMADAYTEFLLEFIEAGEEGVLHNFPGDIDNPEEMIRQLQNHTEGIDAPGGLVPCTAYWLQSIESELLGEVHIRHALTPALEDYGGHIGYMVRPRQRCRGHATRMLALALEKAREMGLHGVMITCEPDNVASARVAQKNGGRLVSETVGRIGRPTSRYWIEVA